MAAQVPMNPKALAAVLHKLGIYDLLCSMHDGVGPFGLRLELRTEILDRGAFASMFFATLRRPRLSMLLQVMMWNFAPSKRMKRQR